MPHGPHGAHHLYTNVLSTQVDVWRFGGELVVVVDLDVGEDSWSCYMSWYRRYFEGCLTFHDSHQQGQSNVPMAAESGKLAREVVELRARLTQLVTTAEAQRASWEAERASWEAVRAKWEAERSSPTSARSSSHISEGNL